MLVAAAVLVASRWAELSDLFKLGLLTGVTAACTGVGHRIKPALPATGSVVFHLGLLLVPANVAAIGVHLTASLGQHLLSQGLVGAVLFTAAAAATGSVVFRWASISSVPLLAAGIGALTPVPALAVLVAFAAAVEWLPQLRMRHAAVVWTGLTGLAPAVIAQLIAVAPGTESELLDAVGLHGLGTAWATGLAATALLAYRAERDRSMEIAGLAIASAVLAVASAIGTTNLQLDEGLFGVASAFLLVQVLALAVSGDRFWKQPLSLLATLTEVPAWFVSVGFAVVCILFAAIADGEFFVLETEPSLAAAFFTAAAGWCVAATRRQQAGGSAVVNVAVAAAATGGVVFATASPAVSGVALVACVVGFALTHRRPLLFGLVASPMAFALTAQNRAAAALAGIALGASLLFQALAQERRDGSARYLSRPLALGACGAALLGAWLAIGTPFAWSLTAIAVIAAMAAIAEAGSHDLANCCRLLFFVPLGVTPGTPREIFMISGAAALALVVDGLRLRRPILVGFGATVSQIAVVAACVDSNLTIPESGIALAFYAVVLTGVSAVGEAMWQRPLVVAAGAAAAGALCVASGDPQAFTIVVMVVGALGLGAGLTTKNNAVANTGGGLIGLGFLLQMSIAHVTGMEFYVLPVAVHLAVVGEIARRRAPVSSWLSTAPGPAILATVAVLERVAGGSAWHALTAAIVAGAAVAVGGSRREAGPLLSGTAVLAVLGLHESFSALAGMPAWGWIGIVGATLIGIAVLIERTDTSPVDAGRRLVDVISENFS